MIKNIAFILGSIDMSIGGVSRVTCTLSRYFEDNGYNCFYIFSGYDTHLIPEEKKIRLDFESLNQQSYVERFCGFIKNNDISLIIDQDFNSDTLLPSLQIIKKETGIKFIFCYHRNPLYNDFIRNISSRKIIIYNWIRKIIRKEDINKPGFVQIKDICDKYVVLSESYIHTFFLRYGMDKKNMLAIANPLPLNFEPISFDDKEKMVFIVSRFQEKIKNIKSIIRIWKNIENKGYNGWKLVIGGYGRDEEELKRYANELNLKSYSFVGRLNDPTIYYKKAQITLMASLCEGFGMTLIEGMQFGCVALAFNYYTAIKDIIINNVNGYIIPPKREKLFSKKLIQLMTDDSLRRSMAINAIKGSQKFSVDCIGEKWINVFKQL